MLSFIWRLPSVPFMTHQPVGIRFSSQPPVRQNNLCNLIIAGNMFFFFPLLRLIMWPTCLTKAPPPPTPPPYSVCIAWVRRSFSLEDPTSKRGRQILISPNGRQLTWPMIVPLIADMTQSVLYNPALHFSEMTHALSVRRSFFVTKCDVNSVDIFLLSYVRNDVGLTRRKKWRVDDKNSLSVLLVIC